MGACMCLCMCLCVVCGCMRACMSDLSEVVTDSGVSIAGDGPGWHLPRRGVLPDPAHWHHATAGGGAGGQVGVE